MCPPDSSESVSGDVPDSPTARTFGKGVDAQDLRRQRAHSPSLGGMRSRKFAGRVWADTVDSDKEIQLQAEIGDDWHLAGGSATFETHCELFLRFIW